MRHGNICFQTPGAGKFIHCFFVAGTARSLEKLLEFSVSEPELDRLMFDAAHIKNIRMWRAHMGEPEYRSYKKERAQIKDTSE